MKHTYSMYCLFTLTNFVCVWYAYHGMHMEAKGQSAAVGSPLSHRSGIELRLLVMVASVVTV